MATKNLPMREALRKALMEEMHRDQRVFIMGQEVGYWQGTHRVTRGFIEEFGEKRVRDTPISEMAIGGAAVGAAMAGLRPIAEFMTINFAFLALDAIVNHAAKIHYMFDGMFKVPLVFRAASGWGDQATASHSHAPEPIFAHFPGLYVGCPATAGDAYGMLKTSIRDDNPVLFSESIALYAKPGPVPDDDNYLIPVGKADIKRPGRHVSLITYARGLEWSLLAAKELEKDGIDCEVVDLRWLRPLDTALVFESFKKTGRAVIVEESLPFYSFGSELAAQIQEHCFDYMDAPIKRVSSLDVPLPYSRHIELMALPNAEKVVAAVKEIL
ncbi:MAG: alpha-ketoacid dehydrogenase subunit beta [Anaerolineae bacterium]|jgi:pyruvate dehydrogenase E1 component beta subunit|nr:alpha-ketoacid dehydrogenase subunit beta [Anaerolineae bacterium]